MKLLRAPAFLLAFLSSAVLARAGTITYNLSNVATTLSGDNSQYGTLTGTIVFDTASDLVTGAQLVFNDPAQGNPTFNTVSAVAAYNGLSQAYIAAPRSTQQNFGAQLALFFNTADLGSGTLSICTSADTCGTAGVRSSFLDIYSDRGNLIYNLTGGTLSSAPPTPAASTPEPCSLVLLGTGILTAAGSLLLWPSAVLARRDAAQLKTSA